jgi:hypothetical protein
MRATDQNAVNEWNEGAEPPNCYTDNFWQAITPDPGENPVTNPPPTIADADENPAASASRPARFLD